MADNPPGRSLAAGALSGRDVVVKVLNQRSTRYIQEP